MFSLITILVAWSIFELSIWGRIVAGTITLAAFLAALVYIYSHIFSPWVAKPLAKAMRQEFREEVRIVILEPQTMALFKEVIEETFALEASVILDLFMEFKEEMDRRDTKIMEKLNKMEANQRIQMKLK